MNGRFKGAALAVLLGASLAVTGPVHAQAKKKIPYWASLSQSEARMRVGPSLDYPSNWIYRRRDLPVKVVQVHGNWRKIEDSAGAQGWMHVRLLSDTPTALVTGGITALRAAPNDGAATLYRAEPGVVGRLTDCSGGWCKMDVAGQKGFVRADSLWGAVEH
jgi:SH3-like domain-containing protein